MDIPALKRSIIENTRLSFARSGGKGGQNVNKVNTKVHAELPFSLLEGLGQEEMEAARIRLDHMINSEGCLFLSVDDERDQAVNRAIALARLEGRIRQAALIAPRRKKTRPSRASKEKRLRGKRLHGEIKRSRAASRSLVR